MLNSSNLNSIIDAAAAAGISSVESLALNPDILDVSKIDDDVSTTPSIASNQRVNQESVPVASAASKRQEQRSLAPLQLGSGFLQICAPPLVKVRAHLKELIGRQNKVYIDLSAEKYKLDNAEIAKLVEMMHKVRVYKEKCVKIKKQMQSIYQRSQSLKRRAANIQSCKDRELQRKLQKQQQEEALIGKQ